MDPRREYSTWTAPQQQHPHQPTYSHPTPHQHQTHSSSASPEHHSNEHSPHSHPQSTPTWNASSLHWNSSPAHHHHHHSQQPQHYSQSSLPPLNHAHSYPTYQNQQHQPHLYSHPSSSTGTYTYMSSSVAPNSTVSPSITNRRLSTTPTDSKDTDVVDPITGHVRPKRKQVKNACQSCQKACKKCDSGRPCSRCVKYGLQDSCRDSVRKERKKGIKRGPYKRNGKHLDKTGNGKYVLEQSAHPRPGESNQLLTAKVEDDEYPSATASLSPNQASMSLGGSQQQDPNGSFSPMSAPASVQRFPINMSVASPADRAIYDRLAARDYTGGLQGGSNGSNGLGLHHPYNHHPGHSVSAHSSPSLGAHPVPHSGSLMAHAHPLPSQMSIMTGGFGSHDRSVSMPAAPHSAPLLSPHSMHNRFPSGPFGQQQPQQPQQHQSHQSNNNPVLPSLSGGNGGWPTNSLFSASHPNNAGLFQHQQQGSSQQQQHQQVYGNGMNLYSNTNGSNLTASGSFFGGHQRLHSEPNYYSSQSNSSSNQNSSNQSSSSMPSLSGHSTSSASNSAASLSPRTPVHSLPPASPASNHSHPIHVHSLQNSNEIVPSMGGPKPFVLKMNAGIRARSSTNASTTTNGSLDELDNEDGNSKNLGSMDPPQSSDNRRFGLV